jgi:hypothetical protein
MANPFNPLDWIRLAQDWFRRTERSSGFRPYLIFILMLFGFSLILLWRFPSDPVIQNTVMLLLEVSVGAFVVFFGIKAFQDPDFCRSEKHVETVKRIALVEQSGDSGPRLIGDDIKEPKPIALPGASAEREP